MLMTLTLCPRQHQLQILIAQQVLQQQQLDLAQLQVLQQQQQRQRQQPTAGVLACYEQAVLQQPFAAQGGLPYEYSCYGPDDLMVYNEHGARALHKALLCVGVGVGQGGGLRVACSRFAANQSHGSYPAVGQHHTRNRAQRVAFLLLFGSGLQHTRTKNATRGSCTADGAFWTVDLCASCVLMHDSVGRRRLSILFFFFK